MYNSNTPTNNELPSTAKLIKSTIIAAVVALVLLVTVVMPSEYGVDPTGSGRMLGLVEMGEIKSSLNAEAEADAIAHSGSTAQEANTVETITTETIEVEPVQENTGHTHGDGNYHSH